MKEKDNEKLLALLTSTAFISALVLAPAHAEPTPTIAVIDVGFNTDTFKNSIVTEACVVQYVLCPNDKQSMEGPGASHVGATGYPKLFDHGTPMLSVILQVNPSAKIIPIRVLGQTPTNTLGVWAEGVYDLAGVKLALDWVIAYRVKYNIAVVSFSATYLTGSGECTTPRQMAGQIATLKAANVPVVVSSGNNSRKNRMGAPACLNDTVSVGATDNPDEGTSGIAWGRNLPPTIANYSNGSIDTDFYTNGRFYTTQRSGATKFTVGTSNSTASLAAYWLLNRKATFDETYAALVASATVAKNKWLAGRYVFIP